MNQNKRTCDRGCGRPATRIVTDWDGEWPAYVCGYHTRGRPQYPIDEVEN